MEEKYVIKYTYINVTLIYTYFYIYFIIEIFNYLYMGVYQEESNDII